MAGELVHRLAQLALVVDDAHRPPAEDVARAHEHRVADVGGDGEGLVEVDGGASRRLGDAEVVTQPVPLLAVLGGVDRLGGRAGDELGGNLRGELQRGLPAEGDDHLGRHAARRRRLGGDDVVHVLGGERLEVQAVGRVVVGRHRLRVAVDHHRLEACLAQGEAGVDAAVVELDALTDAVRAGAEDHDPGPV